MLSASLRPYSANHYRPGLEGATRLAVIYVAALAFLTACSTSGSPAPSLTIPGAVTSAAPDTFITKVGATPQHADIDPGHYDFGEFPGNAPVPQSIQVWVFDSQAELQADLDASPPSCSSATKTLITVEDRVRIQVEAANEPPPYYKSPQQIARILGGTIRLTVPPC